MLNITVEQIKDYKACCGFDAALLGKCYARAKALHIGNLPEKIKAIKDYETEYNNATIFNRHDVDKKMLKYGF